MKKDTCIKILLILLIAGLLPSKPLLPQDSLSQMQPNNLQIVIPAETVSDTTSGTPQVDTVLRNPIQSDSQPDEVVHLPARNEIDKSKEPERRKTMDTAIQKQIKPPAVTVQSDTVHQKTQDRDTAGQEIKSLRETLSTSKLFLSLIVLIAGWLSLRYLTMLLNIFSERWPQYRLSIKGLIPVIRIGSWTLILFFIIVAIMQPQIQTIWAITASAGIAIGFASQDILKNIFGGFLILIDKPFKVGDKIQIDTYYGEVVNIGLRTVRIVTPDDSLVSIPNGEIVNKSVSNANTGAPDCQVVAEFYFEKDIDMNKAHTLAVRCASISRYVFLNKPISATFRNEIYEGRSMIKMRLKAYVFDHRFEFAFITDMSKIVFREFSKAGLNT